MGTVQKSLNMDMTHGSLAKKILLFSLPLMGTSVLQLLFNAADIIVVGRFAGNVYLAAVGATHSLVQLLVGLFTGLSVGANVLMAQTIGRSADAEERKKVIDTCVHISVISGMILLFVGIFFAKKMLTLMGTPIGVINYATLYLDIYFLGMPSMMIYNFSSALLRAKGDTVHALLYLSIAGVVNIGLNCFFVIVLHMHVVGVALATTISQSLSAVLVLRCLVKEEHEIFLKQRKGRIDRCCLQQLMKFGIPAGIQGVLFSLSHVIIQSSVNSFGTDMIAGTAAAVNITGFLYVITNAFYHCALTFNGQNMGAGHYERVDRATLLCLLYATLFGNVLSVMAYFFGNFLLGIYTTSASVMTAGMIRLKYAGVFQGLCGMMDVMSGSIRGIGYSVLPMVISFVGSCVLRIAWVATIFQKFHTPEILFVSYPVSWVLTFGALSLCYMILRNRIRRL